MINPGYWSPPSVWDLNRITGGLGIEDVLYMFFVGAIAAGLYEVILKFKISKKTDKNLKKGHALLVGLIAGATVFAFTPVNVVYFFIILQFSGALVIVLQRRDLVSHALVGGVFFMFLYGTLFMIFKFLFPSFLDSYYHLERTSQIWIIGIPLEELLYSFSLGLMWAPLYEYEYRTRDYRLRRLKLGRV